MSVHGGCPEKALWFVSALVGIGQVNISLILRGKVFGKVAWPAMVGCYSLGAET